MRKYNHIPDIYNCGVYKIYHITDPNKLYVGSSYAMNIRYLHHLDAFRRQIHHSKELQSFVNKFGLDGIRCEVLAICKNKEEQLFMEQFYIDKLEPVYNTCKFSTSSKGYKHRPEVIEAFSKQRKGKTRPPFSEETRKKISESAKLRDLSYLRTDELKIMLSEMYKGRPASENTYLASRKKIDQFSLEGKFIISHASINAAAKYIGVHASNISMVVNGKRKSTGGFLFKFELKL